MVEKCSAVSLESTVIRKVIVDAIELTQLDAHVKNVSGAFINLDISYVDIVLQKLKDTDFSRQFMNNGLLFIWADKTRLCEIIDLMEEKKFLYVENIIFSVFDFNKVSALVQQLTFKTNNRKRTVETSYKVQNDLANDSQLSWAEVAKYLLTQPFDLQAEDSVENYLLRFPSEFIATNKRTLLVFKRVS